MSSASNAAQRCCFVSLPAILNDLGGAGMKKIGEMQVIVGCMFSGKSTELIRRLAKAIEQGQQVQIFKPAVDTRYSTHQIVSHDRSALPAQALKSSLEILHFIDENVDLVGIDEAQFFDQEIEKVLPILLLKGVKVILAGLDTDWRGRPFAAIPGILALADTVTKLKADCEVCGQPANRSQRLVNSDQDILIGTSKYEPRCLAHFSVYRAEIKSTERRSSFQPVKVFDQPMI